MAMIKDLGRLKPAIKETLAVAEKTWLYVGAFSPGQEIADFLNLDPAQVAGEAMIANRADGLTDVYIFI